MMLSRRRCFAALAAAPVAAAISPDEEPTWRMIHDGTDPVIEAVAKADAEWEAIFQAYRELDAKTFADLQSLNVKLMQRLYFVGEPMPPTLLDVGDDA